jgi:hypothetical protein
MNNMPDKEALYINAGKIVVFSSGEYSDYSLHGMFVGLQDVTFEQAQEIVTEVNAAADKIDEEGGWSDRHMMYQAALIGKGYLMEVDYVNRWIGSYSDLTVYGNW